VQATNRQSGGRRRESSESLRHDHLLDDFGFVIDHEARIAFDAALGDEGKNRMNKLSEENVASVEDNLFMVNPDWSFVEKSWVDADPQYWGGEPATKPAHTPAAGAASAPKASPTH
jgi:hypothetical protein